ncbi:RNase adapter RapZ [Benzoatithermus flavus]|uniref:RNase adapter RapZ n=1 Tax=Benzoatithermus flavus TaxID=3108223 RepID=A0ABU8XM86_9PROT
MSDIVVVTGMSGAGRTSCLKILEDLGFEAVDNLPVNLLARISRSDESGPQRLAIGIDSRTRGFAPERLLMALTEVKAQPGLSPILLFLECEDEVLRRRFSETRRRHPLAEISAVGDALAAERRLMEPLKAAADILIDTSELSLPDLRRILAGRFGAEDRRLTIAVLSFAYRHGLPREADLVFDVRFLRNPHYVDALRPLTGLDAAVQEHIRADPDFAGFVGNLEALVLPLLPRYQNEGKSYLTIAFGCTGGKHRSVFLAEMTSEWLRRRGWNATTVHRELARGTQD